MKKPVIFGIYGKSNSGKTSLITRLIEKFSKENFNVASIKITDKKINADKAEKDTNKHKLAGSEIVVFSSKVETDIILAKHMKLDEIIEKIILFSDFDLILVEGINDSDTKKIRIGDIKRRKNTIIDYKNNFEEVYDLISKRIKE